MNKINKNYNHVIGECPLCGSENIVYGKEYLQDDFMHFPAKCADCDTTFEEAYYLDYYKKINICAKADKTEKSDE